MYYIEYLPIAKEDIVEIGRYINFTLSNPMAAKKIVKEIVASIDGLSEFPYKNRAYTPIKPLSEEYRRLIVGNYIVFYCVNEEEKIVSIARVIYSKRNYENLI